MGTNAGRDVTVFEERAEIPRRAAEQFAEQAEAAAAAADGMFTVALSGGSTPRALYELLAGEGYRDRIAWDRTHLFWGDERHVPPDHAESNYRMTNETLLSRVGVPGGNVHRIRGEQPDARRAAEEYERELREFFASGARVQRGLPRFDLVLLGMGPDGHTASLFPGTHAVRERERWVVAPWVDKLQTYRVTLTPPVFNNASSVVFLVSGADKAEALREVLEGPEQSDRYPAQVIRPADGALRWLVDRSAARRLRFGR